MGETRRTNRAVAPAALAGLAVRRMTPADLPAAARLRATDRAWLAALDRPVFGADRTGLLLDLVAAHPPGCVLLDGRDGRGYICSRPGAHSWYLGPLVATAPAAAARLLHAALQPLHGEPVVLDVPAPNAAAAALLTTLGFAPQRPFLRMARGPGWSPEARPEYFSIPGPELG